MVICLAPDQIDSFLEEFRNDSFYAPPTEVVLKQIQHQGQFNIIHLDSGSKADLIIILDKGVIVGMGSHERLIRSNVYYRRLFERHYELPTFEEAPLHV